MHFSNETVSYISSLISIIEHKYLYGKKKFLLKDITGNKKFWEALRPVLVTKELNLAVDEENLFDDKKCWKLLSAIFYQFFFFIR